MRTIYIDSDYKCHATAGDNMSPTETAAFDGKCDAFVEGYCYVPYGKTWVREDGLEFRGEMIAPWKDYAILEAYQEQYEAMLPEIQDMQTALNTMGVSIDG